MKRLCRKNFKATNEQVSNTLRVRQRQRIDSIAHFVSRVNSPVLKV